MRIFLDDGNGRRQINQMSFAQNKQAIAIVDCFGRLIPQEGVDYDIEITFKGSYNPSVSMNIVALTDKGEWWKQYVAKMIGKYPPQIENPEPSIPIDTHAEKEEDHAPDVS